MSRRTVFVIALSYLSILLALALLFFVKRDWLFFVPDAFGPVALGVPWFGALGAVLISLTGVFQHEHDWDASYWPWHLARPLIGVALGVVSVLILEAGVLSVSSTPEQPPAMVQQPAPVSPGPQATASPSPQAGDSAQPQASGSPSPQPARAPKPQTGGSKTPPNSLLYYLIAFLVGYREETFRELIKRLVDVVLAPGDGGGTAPAITGVNPPHAPHDTATQVTINGSGFTDTQTVRFGNAAAKFTVSSDGQLTVTTPTLANGPFPLDVPLTVTTKRGSATVQFSFT